MTSALSMQPRCVSGELSDNYPKRLRALATLKGLVPSARDAAPDPRTKPRQAARPRRNTPRSRPHGPKGRQA